MALKRGKRFEGSVAARWVAWSLCAAFFVMTFFVYALMFLNEADIVRGGLPFLGIASAVVGSLVASRQPRNVVGWFFLASAVFSTVRALFGEYAIYGIETSPGSVPFAEVAAWASLVLRVSGPILGFVCVPLFFPTGRPPSRRWSILVWTLLALTPVLMVFDAVAPVVAVYGTDIRNPFGLDALAPYMGFFQVFLIVCIVAFIFAAAMSLVARFRASSGVERQQIKWIALAAAILPVWFTINGPIGENFPLAFIIADSLIIAGIPVAAGLAILRYRLYDIDFIINKTLVYGTLTAALVAVCLGMIVGSQFFFRSLTGGGSQIAIVASTLANVALFNPMRRRNKISLTDVFTAPATMPARLSPSSRRGSEARRTSTASRKTSSRSSKRPSSRNMPRCG
ncbi:MAG: hypothetical protein M3494_13995 [Actinomycetota bacterium]|nr:hypothetical protein [Actinomycetota bacterium]